MNRGREDRPGRGSRCRSGWAIVALCVAIGGGAWTAPALAQADGSFRGGSDARAADIASRVEIVRTTYGVPHILADDLEAMGYALGWVQSEDYGDQVAIGLVKRRGTYARYVGIDSIDGDFSARRSHARAHATFHLLDPDAQAVYRGFAEGVNRYIRLHPGLFPDWLEPDFTGVDALAADVQSWSQGDAAGFVRSQRRRTEGAQAPEGPSHPDAFDPELDGSNAWALAGSRTTTGNTILLRNPHLSWTAGYYEAHVRVPGVLDFYGDFRIGGAFGIIGGFNEHLGWATTNNSPRYSQVYALARHPRLDGHAMLDGEPVIVEERSVTVDFLDEGGGYDTETETTSWTPFGPVIHEDDDFLYVLKDPRDGEYRRGEQFLRMMRTTTLDEWLSVMRTRAHPSSNFTYADGDGNIVLYYNARIPKLPHESTGDTAAIATSVDDMWHELVAWDDLPLYLNPPGGYVQQANDTPDFINLNVPLDRDTVAPNLPEPRLRLRSQLSFDLIHRDDRLSLEDVVERKHSPRMLLAERVLDELLEMVDEASDADLGEARSILAAWDRSASIPSRGGVLFARWWDHYDELADTAAFWESWDVERPTETPRGIGSPGKAVAALRYAVEDMREEGLDLDVPWGDVHRVIRGDVDEPVAGCEGSMGCFRTLSFEDTDDGRRAANRGDGWVFAVEFTEGAPRAYTVLAYGQSALEESPHFDDQAAMFARGEMKPIAWTDADIERTTIRRYRPGVEGTDDAGLDPAAEGSSEEERRLEGAEEGRR